MILTGTLPAFHLEAPVRVSQRTLTFAERVAYQRAIEAVYWRHRIWPGERPDPKPSLDAVISQAQLEKKVTAYLRKSQALEDYWQRPITSEQLQAEMDRMAHHTKQPDVLRELFAALGNDPFIIAECLARPMLAERLLTDWYADDVRIHAVLKQGAEAELLANPGVDQMKQTSGQYSEIELIKSDSQDDATSSRGGGLRLTSREWDEKARKLAAKGQSLQEDDTHYYATAIIEKRNDHVKLATVSWRKEPLDSWLARAEKQATALAEPHGDYTLPEIATGGCIEGTWTTTASPPDGRQHHTAIWTGSEMIVWGGQAGNIIALFSTGGKYNPSTDTWVTTSATNAPTARTNHTALWTGSEMIIWGGQDQTFFQVNTGGRYNPGTDTWITTTTADAPAARSDHTAVWTGTEMVVWGGTLDSTGGKYNPNTNSWTAMSTTNAPPARSDHTAVWAGTTMIVWGGEGISGFLNTGGRYNPNTNTWTATSTSNVPTARRFHTAVWSGTEMIVWAGDDQNGFSLNSGGRYNPNANTWTATNTTNAPAGRRWHTAVWSGTEMIVWGGFDGNTSFDTGGRYNPGTNNWTPTSTTNVPWPRDSHTAVWTGTEMVIWGGTIGWDLNTGGRYNPSTDSWIPTSVSNTPDGRAYHTSVWTGSEMIVWGGRFDIFSFDTGGVYDPAIDSWTATTTADAPTARRSHTAVWTGNDMIVWGGTDLSTTFNTGGRYNPGANTWTATSTNNAPEGRIYHTAVWASSTDDYLGRRRRKSLSARQWR